MTRFVRAMNACENSSRFSVELWELVPMAPSTVAEVEGAGAAEELLAALELAGALEDADLETDELDGVALVVVWVVVWVVLVVLGVVWVVVVVFFSVVLVVVSSPPLPLSSAKLQSP
jgi:hypothetical protein